VSRRDTLFPLGSGTLGDEAGAGERAGSAVVLIGGAGDGAVTGITSDLASGFGGEGAGCALAASGALLAAVCACWCRGGVFAKAGAGELLPQPMVATETPTGKGKQAVTFEGWAGHLGLNLLQQVGLKDSKYPENYKILTAMSD